MSHHQPYHPRITPLRALRLLRLLERAGDTPQRYLLDELREALGHHVAAGLRRTRRGRR
jgi:hypothetical protein